MDGMSLKQVLSTETILADNVGAFRECRSVGGGSMAPAPPRSANGDGVEKGELRPMSTTVAETLGIGARRLRPRPRRRPIRRVANRSLGCRATPRRGARRSRRSTGRTSVAFRVAEWAVGGLRGGGRGGRRSAHDDGVAKARAPKRRRRVTPEQVQSGVDRKGRGWGGGVPRGGRTTRK